MSKHQLHVQRKGTRATITVNMKLVRILIGLFLMFHVISSVPVDTEVKKGTAN